MSLRGSLLALAWLLCAALVACVGSGAGRGDAEATVRVGASSPTTPPERVVLISVAGLRPVEYGAGDPQAGLQLRGVEMPNLARLAREGAYADAMTPVFPAALYPVHATFVTGLRPDRHGVLGDEVLGPQGLHVRGISRAGRIHGTPVWRAAQMTGLSVTALNWPLTRDADIPLLLPDMGVPDRDPDQNWLGLLSQDATPWIVDRLRRLDPGLADVSWPDPVQRDVLVERLACEIAMQPTRPALWLLTFEETGVALARDGPGSDGARAAFQDVDAALGRLVDCFQTAGILEGTTFLLVGDRALFPLHTIVYPNVVLESVGLITLAPMYLGSGVASWDAFVRSYGGSAVVYASGEHEALLARRALEEQVSRTRAFRIVPASELSALHADPQAWFGIEGEAGFGIGKLARGAVLQPTPRRGLGGYLPTDPGSSVGFVAWGAGIRPGVRVREMSQIDVAPTLADLLGFPLPGADGAPVVDILGRARQPGRPSR